MQYYQRSQIILHWLIFFLLMITYSCMEFKGWVSKSSPIRPYIVQTHFLCGLTILILMLVRVFYRLQFSSPPIIPPLPLWQKIAAKSVQILMYGTFILLPLLGFTTVYLSGRAWQIYSIPMPTALIADLALRSKIKMWHEGLANFSYFLVGLHTAAALFHHYYLKDNALLSMLPHRRSQNAE